MHCHERRMVFWDDGKGKFSCTTMENTRLRYYPGGTAGAIERLSGEKWKTETVISEEVVRDAKERYAKGELSAVYVLIETGFMTGKYSGHLEEEGPPSNVLLELPPKTLDEVVQDALDSFGQ
ncbi:hypothetical protein LTS18_006250 [Coniosporium uncinatum]|uniref:Uncharacterized protein n=1 Tax=Coniosporium uncinatum TaxID=93489 RepID=A0ACC3D3W1_9PEZI|nr:hypothetical protein LTS18_006250 [Coniosporium uncinatum]